jgi:hypothetical protein
MGKKLLLAVTALLVSLVIGEFAVRVFVGSPP